MATSDAGSSTLRALLDPEIRAPTLASTPISSSSTPTTLIATPPTTGSAAAHHATTSALIAMPPATGSASAHQVTLGAMPSAHLLPPLQSFRASTALAIPITSTRVTPAASACGSTTTAPDKSVEQLLATQLTSLLQNAAAAASSATQTDKVIIAPGLPAIPTKLLKRMHNWEYIELTQLLPQSSSHDAAMDAQRFALFPGFELVRAKPQKMIANIVDWTKCFTIYVAAMAIKFPEVVTEMLAYQLVIIKASQQYDGLYWRVYDTHFRVNAAASGNRKWSQLDTDLYTRFFTGRAREIPHCLLCNSTSHTDAQCPHNTGRKRPQPSHTLPAAKKRKWAGNVCFSFNASGSCQFKNCKCEHKCGVCSGNHPAKLCTKPTPN